VRQWADQTRPVVCSVPEKFPVGPTARDRLFSLWLRVSGHVVMASECGAAQRIIIGISPRACRTWRKVLPNWRHAADRAWAKLPDAEVAAGRMALLRAVAAAQFLTWRLDLWRPHFGKDAFAPKRGRDRSACKCGWRWFWLFTACRERREINRMLL